MERASPRSRLKCAWWKEAEEFEAGNLFIINNILTLFIQKKKEFEVVLRCFRETMDLGQLHTRERGSVSVWGFGFKCYVSVFGYELGLP